MFELGTGGLAAAYVMLGVILLSLHLYSRWSHWIKIMVTVLATVFMLVTYKSLPGLQGWPLTTDKLPSRLYLLAIEISEPDNIYLWARDLDVGTELQRPRAYELPYSSKLHQQAVGSGRKLRRNIAQIVEIDPAGKTVKVPGSSDIPVKQNIIRFLDAPQGLLPPKE
ncbi:hypothetical protein [Anderseniella sp. Alg231-50]|uniref:hypothetical protein n=1 Tax=Anderseniella sp. Alg231-50 TaxID=1922226 RepID=UPI000D550EB8